MKIIHVVTFISSDGAFGGPVTVALGHAKALAANGHDVVVFAASPASEVVSRQQDGYLLQTFPARRLAKALGFAGMFSPELTRALKRELFTADVVHVHMARDFVTLPAAKATLRAGVPLVLQTHGMIDQSDKLLAKPVDAVWVRPILRRARQVLVLTEQEASDITGLVSDARVLAIKNGMASEELPPYEGRLEQVLFLARLHPRKRAGAFIEMAKLLGERDIKHRFVIAGPDEGEGPAVRDKIEELGSTIDIDWVGPLDQTESRSRMRESLVYVLPSEGEVFPMTILEAFVAGTPVVTTTSLGMAQLCQKYGAAILTDGSPSQLADAVERITEDNTVAQSLREGGQRLLAEELGMDSVVETLVETYSKQRNTDRKTG